MVPSNHGCVPVEDEVSLDNTPGPLLYNIAQPPATRPIAQRHYNT